MLYLLGFSVAFALSFAVTPIVRRIALRFEIMDRPGEARKVHTRSVAYLGGLAIFTGFVLTVAWLLPQNRQLAALLLGCLILVVVGAVDDIRGLSPWVKLGWQFLAAMVALAGGIGITSITNPFGGVIDLTYGRVPLDLFGLKFHITPIANAVSLLWMVGLVNTINFLDGLDGLACGVSGIAAIIIFLLSIGPRVNQPAVALLAIILAGAALGFLPFNFYPARIFMGDSGAYFLGLTLAMLAIYSGAKLATAMLVLALPIFDALWAAVRRVAKGHSPFKADRRHLHHLLLDVGMTQREAVLTLYAVALALGILALVVGSLGKLMAIAGSMMFMVLLVPALLLLSWLRIRRQKIG
jgi:UDP-GlcNAc:undecaprenyl-phosphate GlcNAc-1-phosphate transferase